jgi:hypothetical protein
MENGLGKAAVGRNNQRRNNQSLSDRRLTAQAAGMLVSMSAASTLVKASLRIRQLCRALRPGTNSPAE